LAHEWAEQTQKTQKTASFQLQITRLTVHWHRARGLLEEKQRFKFRCAGQARLRRVHQR
jgi:hypothetical protein